MLGSIRVGPRCKSALTQAPGLRRRRGARRGGCGMPAPEAGAEVALAAGPATPALQDLGFALLAPQAEAPYAQRQKPPPLRAVISSLSDQTTIRRLLGVALI